MSAADWNHVDDRGHCVHCGDQSHCQLQQHRTQDALVGWLAACCPYNAEAKRIAATLERVRDSGAFADDMAGQAVVDMCRKLALGIIRA